jgi:hypothetical protein
MVATKAQREVESTVRSMTRADQARAEARWVSAWARRDLPHSPEARARAERERRVRELAYTIAEEHGFTPGRELDDWLEAERRVDAEERAAPRRSADN